MTKSLSVGQIIALNHTLTQYPMQLSFADIFTALKYGDDNVIVQDDFCDWDELALFNFINDLAKDIDQEIANAMR